MTRKPDDSSSKAAPEAQKSQQNQTDASAQTANSADADYLKNSQGEGASISSEEEAYLLSLLEELHFLQHKEKKPTPEAAKQQGQQVMQKLKVAPAKIARPAQEILLGILGPCALKGHIVHFFNLRFDIEKHIRSVSELTEPRFVEAYQYLRQHPSVDAVFVYENRMAAAYMLNGTIKFRNI